MTSKQIVKDKRFRRIMLTLDTHISLNTVNVDAWPQNTPQHTRVYIYYNRSKTEKRRMRKNRRNLRPEFFLPCTAFHADIRFPTLSFNSCIFIILCRTTASILQVYHCMLKGLFTLSSMPYVYPGNPRKPEQKIYIRIRGRLVASRGQNFRRKNLS
jgi:hypothetical protein